MAAGRSEAFRVEQLLQLAAVQEPRPVDATSIRPLFPPQIFKTLPLTGPQSFRELELRGCA